MHRERRTLTTLTARDLTDPGPVPIRVLDSGLLMGGTFNESSVLPLRLMAESYAAIVCGKSWYTSPVTHR